MNLGLKTLCAGASTMPKLIKPRKHACRATCPMQEDDEAASLALALALSGGYAEPVRRSGRAAAITATVAIKVSTSAQPQ